MRKIVFLLSLCFAPFVCAESYFAVGKIKTLRTHDQSVYKNNDWIIVEGFASAGKCKASADGVLLMINNASQDSGERMFANILMAKGSDRAVQVGVDDTKINGAGYCYLRWINIKD